MSQIKIKSSDDEIFEVALDVAKCSTTIKTMLEDLGLEDGDDELIPLPNVPSNVLRKIFQWANRHKDDTPVEPQPLEMEKDDDGVYRGEKKKIEIGEWDTEFLKVDQAMLFELIKAANFLDIKGLLEIGCQTVANMMKGKTAAGIRQLFNIEEDFFPEVVDFWGVDRPEEEKKAEEEKKKKKEEEKKRRKAEKEKAAKEKAEKEQKENGEAAEVRNEPVAGPAGPSRPQVVALPKQTVGLEENAENKEEAVDKGDVKTETEEKKEPVAEDGEKRQEERTENKDADGKEETEGKSESDDKDKNAEVADPQKENKEESAKTTE